MKPEIRRALRKYVNNFKRDMSFKSISVEGFGDKKRIKFEKGFNGYRLKTGSIFIEGIDGNFLDSPARTYFIYEHKEIILPQRNPRIIYPKGIYMKIFSPEYEPFGASQLEIPRLMSTLRVWAKQNSEMNLGDLGYLLQEI